MQDDDLDRLLAAAAAAPARPSDDLMRRVLADALAQQPQPPVLQAGPVAVRPGLLSRIAAALGGGPVLAGLGTAAVFGLALGYLSPATLDYLTGATADAAEFFPDADFLTTEG
ncbi:dihydroorotate dehydrogenase [Rhodobacter calidifons]|uniref:Dihydroorotate dehydrogenase n=1 Tax=Rhodobacter calidifons TaxID=2715277 RepID=A0ABX0GB66_9RHOB|nr:dihydroorotate dehydrogenase [Rhodobacter calidifons]NHB78521.1 dihydroorotate dehydrogenase [Rhodobacter calidifons]